MAESAPIKSIARMLLEAARQDEAAFVLLAIQWALAQLEQAELA